MAKKRKEEMRRFGKKPRQKLIGGIILLLLLSAVYSGYLLISNLTSNALTSPYLPDESTEQAGGQNLFPVPVRLSGY